MVESRRLRRASAESDEPSSSGATLRDRLKGAGDFYVGSLLWPVISVQQPDLYEIRPPLDRDWRRGRILVLERHDVLSLQLAAMVAAIRGSSAAPPARDVYPPPARIRVTFIVAAG
jgi:hypothetical protein